eukprot:6299078-Lingulodinium_polyedra.AAC.1
MQQATSSAPASGNYSAPGCRVLESAGPSCREARYYSACGYSWLFFAHTRLLLVLRRRQAP